MEVVRDLLSEKRKPATVAGFSDLQDLQLVQPG